MGIVENMLRLAENTILYSICKVLHNRPNHEICTTVNSKPPSSSFCFSYGSYGGKDDDFEKMEKT